MFREDRDTLRFEWSHLGDVAKGRPHLGPATTVAAYRLMEFTLRDAAIKHAGVATADRIFYDAGFKAGQEIYRNLLDNPADVAELVSRLQQTMREQGLGILRVEETDLDALRFVLTVTEDLDCSGLPAIDEAVCTYDEGFVAGILSAHTGRKMRAKEIDCWCTGERVCRFVAEPADE